jgi:HSP20 family protein
MSLIRWSDPLTGMDSLHRELDDMFSSFFGQTLTTSSSPAMDIYTEDDKQLVTEVHLPGFQKDEVDVQVHNGMLEIKGEKHEKEEKKDTKRTYMVRQSSSQFYRSIALPKQANGDEVEAHFEDGVLKVTIPFKEVPTPKKVAISGK